MKLLKAKHALFFTGVNIAHNVRSHIDVERHGDTVKELWLQPESGLFVVEQSGKIVFIPNENMPGGVTLHESEVLDTEPKRGPGRPPKEAA